MKNLMRLVVVALVAIAFGGTCMASSPAKNKSYNEDKTVEVRRNIGKISSIEVEAPVKVVYVQNSTPSLRLVGKKEYVDNIVVTQDGGELEFGAKDSKVYNGRNYNGSHKGNFDFSDFMVVAYVSSPSLSSVSVESAGAFESTTPMRMNDIKFDLEGAANVNISNLNCNRLKLEVEGAAVLNVNATAKNADLGFEGAVNANLTLSNTTRTNVNVEGVANVGIHFINGGTADCNVEGLGKLTLSGTLRNLRKEVSGMSHIYTSKLKFTDVK